jgi:hypothetical protein
VNFFFDKCILAVECNNKLHITLIKKIIKKKIGKVLIFTNRIEYLNIFVKFKKQVDIYYIEKSEILSIINYLCLYALLTIPDYCLYVKNLTQKICDNLIKLKYKEKIEKEVDIYKKILVIPFYVKFSNQGNNKFISVFDFYKINLKKINKIYKKNFTFKEIEENIKLIIKVIKIKKFIYFNGLKDDLLLKLAVKRYMNKITSLFFLLALYFMPRRVKFIKNLKDKFLKITNTEYVNRFAIYHRFAVYQDYKIILLKNVTQR